jgi:tRNA(Ile)-lysidine synthase
VSSQVPRIDRHKFASIRRGRAYRAIADSWTRPVILAVSGGIDSMAMLAVSGVAKNAGRVGPFVVAHVDHGVRSQSAREGRIVADVAGRLGCPFVQLTPDPDPATFSAGPEAGLRRLRYDALGRLGSVFGVRTVVTAHTEDDQVETILMRLLSGSSSIANAGMRREQRLGTPWGEIEILRPLLGVPRSHLETVLHLLNLDHVDDPSNRDPRFRRNRLRTRVLPELRKLDAGFAPGLIRSVEHARQDGEVVDRLSVKIYQDVVDQSQAGITLPLKAVNDNEPAISSRIVRMAILELVHGDARELSHERIMAVVEAARRSTAGTMTTIELPYGILAEVKGGCSVTVVRRVEDSAE